MNEVTYEVTFTDGNKKLMTVKGEDRLQKLFHYIAEYTFYSPDDIDSINVR